MNREEFEAVNEAELDKHKDLANEKGNGFGFAMLFSDMLEKLYKDNNLTAKGLRVFIYLYKHADNNTGSSYHSLKEIADTMGISVKTVQRAMNELEEGGYIKRFRRYNNSVVTYIVFNQQSEDVTG